MHIGAKHEVPQGLMGLSLVCGCSVRNQSWGGGKSYLPDVCVRLKDMYGGPEVQATTANRETRSQIRNPINQRENKTANLKAH